VAGKAKAHTLLICGAIFLFGAVSLYPCAAGSETATTVKKSCHAEKTHHSSPSDKGDQQNQKTKPCCTLHCYNPAQAHALFAVSRPTRLTLGVEQEDVIFVSLTITPPNPPPQVS
jgi:hypothetical protein